MLLEDYGHYVLKGDKYRLSEGYCPIIAIAHEFFDAMPANIF